MRQINILLSFAFLVLLVGCGVNSTRTEPSSFCEGEPYLRVENGKFIASTKTFKKEGAPKVTLLAVTHIAEKAFYEQAQAKLDAADLVLFEQPSVDDYSEIRSTSCLALNGALDHSHRAQKLGLSDQAKELIHPPGKSVQADMSIEQTLDFILATPTAQAILEKRHFPKATMFDSQRCLSFLHIFHEWSKERISHYKTTGEVPLTFEMPEDINAGLKLDIEDMRIGLNKNISPRELIARETLESKLDSPAGQAITAGLLDFRNVAPLKHLANYMHLGPEKEIVILYGAAHMNGIEAGLLAQYGYVPDVEVRNVLWHL